MSKTRRIQNPPRVWNLASVLILICSLRLYGQGADPRAAAAAKAAVAQAARATYSAATLPAATAVGTFVTFDAPGAVNGTFPAAISNGGAVTGFYIDNVGSGHGFVRAANASFITFDVLGAINGTVPTVINSAGEVTGYYFDVNFINHAFLRESSGSVTTFDAPGAVFTSPSMITDDGGILGFYSDASFNTHGFVRSRSGAFTEISGPGGLSGQVDSFNPGPALTINPSGVIVGTYFEPITGNPLGGNFRVFLLSASGDYTTFDAANYPPCCIWSAPSGINPAGTVIGSFNDGFTINHGFVRTSDGTLTIFDATGAGTGFNQDTLPVGISPGGIIVLQYRDSTTLIHGFLLLTSGQ